MKKILLFLLLLTQIAIGQTATGTTKAGKYQMNTPDLGTKQDSVVVWNGTSKLLKYVPASTLTPVTNLNYTASPTIGIVSTGVGTNATIPVANVTNSGLFLPEEKIKLTFVETGAEVNVNADWNATSGDAEILNKPTIPSIAGLSTKSYVDAQDDLKVDKVAGERLITASEITNLANQSGVNTGDNAINSNYAADYRLSNFVSGVDYLSPNGSASGLTGFPTLNQNTTGSASTITGNITESQVTGLVSDLASKQGTITLTTTGTSGAATLIGNTLNIPSYSGGGSTPDATTTVKGIVKLAGDLAGTADLPTVPALAGKQATLVSGTNIKTLGGVSILGSGNVTQVQNSLTASTVLAPSVDALNTALALKATDTGVIHTTGSETKSGLLTLTAGVTSNTSIVGNSGLILTQIAQAPNGTTTTFATSVSTPEMMVKDATGNLYVTNNSTNTVTKITPAGVTSTYGTTGNFPRGLIFDSAGNLYVSNENDNTITKITTGGVSSLFGTTGSSPHTMVFDTSGNLFVACGGTGITKITPAGVSSSFYTYTSFAIGRGIAIDASNNIYTVHNQTGVVTKITPAGVASTFATIRAGSLFWVFDNLYNLYVGTSSRVSKVTPAGVVTEYALPSNSTPWGMAVDLGNNLYVSVNSGSYVARLSPSGLITSIGVTGGSPKGLVVTNTGDVYTANGTGKSISKISPSRFTLLTTSSSGLVSPASDISIANGIISAPSSTILNLIDPKSLITKEYADNVYGVIKNTTSTPLSSITLTTAYPNAGIGLRVHCMNISGGAHIYEKTELGWADHAVTFMP